MGVRTDIAVEFLGEESEMIDGVSCEESTQNGVKITEVKINTDSAAQKIGKPKGRYITFETDICFDVSYSDELCELLARKFCDYIGKKVKTTLVVGIGNSEVTPDALGPKAAKGVIATRHIESQLADSIGLKGLRPVATVSPGVLGQTGLEISEIIKGVVSKIDVDLIILVDALAARDISRLGRTVQISNTGIIPGSGVGNSRIELSCETLGVDCVTIGVPTVVDAATLCQQLTGVGCPQNEPFIVTQRDIDMIIKNAADIISKALNFALQPDIDRELLLSLMK
ncbi:MAG: GPR endopeptidase [Ruminococcaceae bacterium]|nr:GPR endopeptidase [Oscillospiraceae bacterium]